MVKAGAEDRRGPAVVLRRAKDGDGVGAGRPDRGRRSARSARRPSGTRRVRRTTSQQSRTTSQRRIGRSGALVPARGIRLIVHHPF